MRFAHLETRREVISGVILAVALAVLPQAGFSLPAVPPAAPEVLGVQEVPVTFDDPLAAIDAQLRRQEWLPARAAALDLIGKNRLHLVASDLAGPVSRLALAEAGLRQDAAAVWHWHAAQNLDRGILSDRQLASFGAPGELLAGRSLRTSGAAPAGLTVFAAEDPEVSAGHRIEGEIPTLPQDLAALRVPKGLRIQVVVDADGRLREPVVLSGGVPGMIWEVLEGLRDWRYEPARKGETPVAVFRTVSINKPAEAPLAGLVSLSEQRAGVESLLQAGQWKKASQRGEKLWKESLVPGNDPRDLATVMTLRALADAGLGHQSQAVCRWQAAQYLDPRLYDADLSRYGNAGALLEANRWGETPAQSFAGYVEPATRQKISVPDASRLLHLSGTLEIAAIRGRDGSLSQPLLLGATSLGESLLDGFRASHGESLATFASRFVAYSALDSICGWSFGGATPYPYSSQIIFTVPFQIAPFTYFGADQSAWYGYGSLRHNQQPRPDGARTPVPQYLPPD